MTDDQRIAAARARSARFAELAADAAESRAKIDGTDIAEARRAAAASKSRLVQLEAGDFCPLVAIAEREGEPATIRDPVLVAFIQSARRHAGNRNARRRLYVQAGDFDHLIALAAGQLNREKPPEKRAPEEPKTPKSRKSSSP